MVIDANYTSRHGKYRPFLPKMVAANPEDNAREITKKAFASYSAKSDVKAAVTIISELKGIGPATASLILAVHDPENVVFFSDEAYHWLCAPESEAAPDLKYTAKEYEELYAKAKILMTRLKVFPIDVEKVAYVLKREIEPNSTTKKSVGRPKARTALSEESKQADTLAGRSRGRPKAAPKPARSGEETTERLENPPAPSGRPRGRPKSVPSPEVPETIKPKNNITEEASLVDSKPTARKSKRKAGEDVPEVDKPAPKRGRPKGKTG